MLTSGKSTTKAFMFSPYRKLAKLSPNLLRLSCINWRCIRFASRSAIESLNSANCGSKASRGDGPVKSLLCDALNEDREDARSGVVGRETGDRDLTLPAGRVCDIALPCDIVRSNAEQR